MHTVRAESHTDHRTEFDVSRGQGLHNLREALPDRGSPALVRSAAFLDSARVVDWNDRKVCIPRHRRKVKVSDWLPHIAAVG
jgi:hypothetical protein